MNEAGQHSGGRWTRAVLWLAAALLTVAITVLASCPASWMGILLEKQTAGRLTLGDPQGSLWRGSAFVGGAAGKNEPVTPLLPGRFAWQLSPLVLIGRVDLLLENAQALTQPVQVQGSWSEWHVSGSAITLPAERLSGLGAPLNTVQPSGTMQLSWGPLQITRESAAVALVGQTTLALNDVASRMSPVRPLGSYVVKMDWQGLQAGLQLSTVRGPMLLSGSGKFANGRMQFSGKAEAEAGQEDKLANLLNLLGQRRRDGDKNSIALEFK
ncbi:general secretion pathway protein N [Actimicrobium sp. GrIS 1.19]|uniref:type II secretion system protein N n=1 Tax=Actimicrobium sp. GrIS 1.19 TaxID=3071708 RepID=UPI002DFF0656|nr:general secretion pathway protein N [Actimicrobium sp. GrIS 1.19]